MMKEGESGQQSSEVVDGVSKQSLGCEQKGSYNQQNRAEVGWPQAYADR